MYKTEFYKTPRGEYPVRDFIQKTGTVLVFGFIVLFLPPVFFYAPTSFGFSLFL